MLDVYQRLSHVAIGGSQGSVGSALDIFFHDLLRHSGAFTAGILLVGMTLRVATAYQRICPALFLIGNLIPRLLRFT
jgi:hypothetical protein